MAERYRDPELTIRSIPRRNGTGYAGLSVEF